jgi:putative membrane protein
MTRATSPLDASTQMAVDRTRLAHERTMMAWVRTATSLISFGFTIYKFFELELRGTAAAAAEGGLIGPRGFALIMIVTGLTALVLGGLQHRQSLRSLAVSYGPQPRSVAGPVAALIGLLGALAFVGVLWKV